MNTKGLIVVWLLFFLAIFAIGYIFTGIVVTHFEKEIKAEIQK